LILAQSKHESWISYRLLSLFYHCSYGFGRQSQIVNEGSPVADPSKNPRSARLINAEKIVLENNGTCIRLAGLYTLTRGAHNFWVTSGKDVSGRADGIINQLHYDDAAGAVLAALSADPSSVSGNVFLISDGHPMTRKEICESAMKNNQYEGVAMPKFLGTDNDPIGKIYDGSASNKALKWDPRYESFDAFMISN
jgi:nucleoside-diphosphate-sugar epimerase